MDKITIASMEVFICYYTEYLEIPMLTVNRTCTKIHLGHHQKYVAKKITIQTKS